MTACDFQPLLDKTQCPFAAKSTWLPSPPADDRLDVEQHLARALPSFRAALDAVVEDGADGYVLQLPARFGETVAALRASTYDVMAWLGARSRPPTPVTLHDLENPDWWFTFDEHRLFAVAFGNCFGSTHTRYQFEAQGLFIVFQHELAFARRYPSGIPFRLRRSIRHAFESAGRPYRYDMGVVPEDAS